MPEKRLARTRATLPEGYQFGDAAPAGERQTEAWAAAVGHVHHFEGLNPATLVSRCRCGALRDEVMHWNTIEGDHA